MAVSLDLPSRITEMERLTPPHPPNSTDLAAFKLNE